MNRAIIGDEMEFLSEIIRTTIPEWISSLDSSAVINYALKAGIAAGSGYVYNLFSKDYCMAIKINKNRKGE